MKVLKTINLFFLLCLFCCTSTNIFASAKDSTGKSKGNKIYEPFRSTRLINLHTVETLKHGVLEFRIAHRFGAINGGGNELWGLDQATMRIALEYGITSNFMAGIGRSTYQKTYDGFLKWSILQQRDKGMPISLTAFSSIAINGVPFTDSSSYFSSRMSFVSQLIIAKKFGNNLTIQLSPTIIHKNLVELVIDKNTTFALGFSGKYNISKSLSLNMEYIYRYKDGVNSPSFTNFHNSFSIGLGIDTRGHFFEFNLSNSFPMVEKSFITESTDNWLKGGIHLGFNIIRDFKVVKPKKKAKF